MQSVMLPVMRSVLLNSSAYILNRQPTPKWSAAKAGVKAGSGRARVGMVGDSYMASYGADNVDTFQGPNTQDARLARQFTAEGLPSTYQACFGGHGVLALSHWDFRISQGTWIYGDVNSFGGSLGGEFLQATAAGTFAFSPKDQNQVVVPVNTFDIYWFRDPSAGAFNYNVDGGTNTLINANGASSLQKTTVNTTLGTHTLNLLWSSGAAYFVGIHGYNSAVKAVDFFDMGWVSSTAVQWAATGFAWNPGSMWSQAPTALDIAFLSVMANDVLNGDTIANGKANLKTVIGQIKAAGTDCVVVSYSPVDLARLTAQAQSDVYTAMYQAAVETGCTFIDILNSMGGPTAYASNLAKGLMIGDGLHRSNSGMTPAVNFEHDVLNA